MNTNASIKEVAAKSLRSRVFHQLEQNIISGKYPPGMALNEKQLCQELGCQPYSSAGGFESAGIRRLG